MTFRREAVVLALVALGALGCGQDGSEDEESAELGAVPPGWDVSVAGPEQRAALQGGEVTRSEYQAGFERFRACLSEEGYELSSIREVGDVLDYGIPAEAVDSGVEGQCYQEHFGFLDEVWQIEHSADRDYIDRVNACLGTDGTDGTASTVAEAEQLLAESGLDLDECG